MTARPIRHGSAGGARAHYRRGEKPCESCRSAANLAHRGTRDPFEATEPERRGPGRNGLAIVPYEYRARRYRWAELAIRRAEAAYGRPGDEPEMLSRRVQAEVAWLVTVQLAGERS
jgi:hypothetical protein